MSRIARLTAASAAALAALALAGPAAGHHKATTTLNGSVGPGFTITLAKSGKKVPKLPAGSYKIVVSDKSAAHNFHITGPGVNKSTTVSGTGTKTFTVTLKKGTYKFVCDPHASSMKGSFTVA